MSGKDTGSTSTASAATGSTAPAKVTSSTPVAASSAASPPANVAPAPVASKTAVANTGTIAASNTTTTRTTGKTGPTIMFPVLNMADQDITVREISGTNQTIDILNKEKGLVAMTLSDGRPPLRYIAVTKGGKERLLISGQKEYVLDLKQLGNVGSFPGLYVHKDGQDWKALVNGQDSNKKTLHFAATDISGEEIVTVEEPAITKLKFDIVKGSIVQGGISSFGISAPFQLKAKSKKTNAELLVNGQKTLYANASKDSSDILNIIVHKEGQDWKEESAGGNLKLTDMMVSQFIIMNMFHKDITVEEVSMGQVIDVQQSEMLQLARPTSARKDGFKFKAMLKDSNKQVLVNGQQVLSLDLNDISMVNILVVHDDGQNWQQIQSSLLQTGSGTSETLSPEDILSNLTHTGSPDYLSLQKAAETAAQKYNLQITAVNMLPNNTIVLEEVTDKKENVDIPGNATATLGLLISGGTQPLRFKAHEKATKSELFVNGKKELLIDPKIAKGLESIIVVGNEGDSWEPTRSATLDLIGSENQGLVQVAETTAPLTNDPANDAKALQLRVVNKANSNIRIQELSSAGEKLDVPKEATATLGFLIRARQEPLKFKAFETTSGSEMLLNGQIILPVDVDSKGINTIIIVHKEGFEFEATREVEYQRMVSASASPSQPQPVAASTAVSSQPLEPAVSAANQYKGVQAFAGKVLTNDTVAAHASGLGPDTAAINAEATALRIANASTTPLRPYPSSYGAAADKVSPPAHVGPPSGKASLRDKSGSKQQYIPETIDFIIANGVNGFVYVEEKSGTGQKVELPVKDALGNLTVKAKARFSPLTFKAAMKDSAQELYVNGKKELDVALEALSPYWLVVHNKGDDWEAIKARLQKSQGLTVDLSQPGVTKLTSNAIPTQLKIIPIAYNNIAGKEAEITEITGTMYKTSASASTAGMFVLPATPIGRTKPVELKANVKGTDEKLQMNGEDVFSIDLNMAYTVMIIHRPDQRWESARKNFHYATLGRYADIAGNGLGNFGGSNVKVGGPDIQPENNAAKNGSAQANETEGAVGSGQAPTETSNIGITNSAGVEAELKLNGKQFKTLPLAATGTITLTVTQGLSSKLEAFAVDNGAQLLLNNEKSLTIDGKSKIGRIVIASQNGSVANAINSANDAPQAGIKYGKVNFINRADKDIKIFEVSGIGEPTVLSPNFISTFFLKSPQESATFRAMDPTNNEAYMLNEQPALEIKLDQNPRVETEVQITRSKAAKKSAAKRPATCMAVTERGPCYSALQYETQVEAAEGKSETCKKYLEEILSKCAQKNMSQGIDGCKRLCNSKDSDVCERIWSPKSCSSSIVRYSFNPDTQTCQSIDYNGCLGNANNFATPEECAKACVSENDAKKPKRHSLEKRMKKIIQRNRLLRPGRDRDSVNSHLISRVLAY